MSLTIYFTKWPNIVINTSNIIPSAHKCEQRLEEMEALRASALSSAACTSVRVSHSLVSSESIMAS